ARVGGLGPGPHRSAGTRRPADGPARRQPGRLQGRDLHLPVFGDGDQVKRWILLIGSVLMAVFAGGIAAWAFWSVGSTSGSAGGARAATLTAPTGAIGHSTAGSSAVGVSWNAATPPAGTLDG